MFKRFGVVALALVLLVPAATALDFDQKAFYGQGVLALPIGDWSDLVNLGFGVGLGMRVPHSDVLSFRGEITYIHFSTEDIPNADWSWSMIPVCVLGEYQMDTMYLLGGLGLFFARSEVKYDNHPEWNFSGSDSELGLVLGAGFELSPSMVLEGRFNLVSDANFLTANLGFRF